MIVAKLFYERFRTDNKDHDTELYEDSDGAAAIDSIRYAIANAWAALGLSYVLVTGEAVEAYASEKAFRDRLRRLDKANKNFVVLKDTGPKNAPD